MKLPSNVKLAASVAMKGSHQTFTAVLTELCEDEPSLVPMMLLISALMAGVGAPIITDVGGWNVPSPPPEDLLAAADISSGLATAWWPASAASTHNVCVAIWSTSHKEGQRYQFWNIAPYKVGGAEPSPKKARIAKEGQAFGR